MTRIGFTGTRTGLQDAQRASLGVLLTLDLEPTEFHHGACVGADGEAHDLVRYTDQHKTVRIVVHPGKSAKGGENEFLHQPSVDDADEVRETKTHFARNRDIVNETDILIGCPGATTWQNRGGTFMTMDYAIKVGKPVYVVWPDGTVEKK